MTSIPRNTRRASVLLAAIIFTALLAMMMIPVMQHFRELSRMAQSNRSSDQAFYAAEAGVARAMSFIFSKGAGEVTGIYDTMFDKTSANACYPFGNGWLSLQEGVQAGSDSVPSMRVRIWADAANNAWKIESVGRMTRPKALYRTVTVTIQAGSFARYAFFNTLSLSTMDGAARWLAGGETFNGPVHSNHDLYVGSGTNANDHLIFNSDVTMVGDEIQTGSSNHIEYNGLKDTSADYIELPSDLSRLTNAAAASGVDLPGDDTSLPAGFADDAIKNYEFQFNDNGTVTITNMDAKTWAATRTPPRTYTPMTVTIANTNGAMIVRDGNVFAKGTVNGRVTIAALANDSSTALVSPTANTKTDGNLIISGDIVYKTHPKVSGSYDISDGRTFDDTVTDVLGLIAERNFTLDAGVPQNCIVDAHIMLTGQASPNPNVSTWAHNTTVAGAVNQDGAFFIEDGVQTDLSALWTGQGSNSSGLSDFGDLYLTGGVVHFLRGQTKNGSGGYDRHYSFDQRLMKSPPPFYPLTPDLEITGWQDVASTTVPGTS